MSIAAIIRRMAEAGASVESIAIAVEAIEVSGLIAPTKSKAAMRTERWRERKAAEASQTVTERHETSQTVTPLVPPSLPPTPPNITPLNPPTTDESATAGPKAKRGSRLPDDWEPDDADRAFAAARGLNPEEIDRGAFEFRNYWTSRAGREACKLNWSRTWQNRVGELADRKRERSAKLASRPAQRPGGGQGVTDFASIIARRNRDGGNPDDVPGERGAIPGSFRVVGAGERP